MRFGKFVGDPIDWPFTPAVQQSTSSLSSISTCTSLHAVALVWLREDRAHRAELEKAGLPLRGARYDGVSHLFFCVPASFDRCRFLICRCRQIPKHSTGSEMFCTDLHFTILSRTESSPRTGMITAINIALIDGSVGHPQSRLSPQVLETISLSASTPIMMNLNCGICLNSRLDTYESFP